MGITVKHIAHVFVIALPVKTGILQSVFQKHKFIRLDVRDRFEIIGGRQIAENRAFNACFVIVKGGGVFLFLGLVFRIIRLAVLVRFCPFLRIFKGTIKLPISL